MLFPAIYTKPLSKDFVSDADKLIQIVELVYQDMDNDSLKLDEWQAWLLRHLLERYPADHEDVSKAGKLRYRAAVVSIPRQSGKSLLGAILGLYGLLMRRGQTLGLASNADQAGIIYQRVLSTINGNSELRAMFKKATERRGIVRADGLSRYDIKPAKESSLQGIRVDTVLADELHIWGKGMWAAMVQGSASADDAIIIGLTTAGDINSETLIELYKQGERAANGDPELERFGFFNWTAPEGCNIDAEAILASNPAVECGRIPLNRVLDDLSTIPEHEARRYRLNQFITSSSVSWLPMSAFYSCATGGITDLTGSVLSVHTTPRLEYATIAAAKKVGDIVQTELVASFINPSEGQLFNELVDLYRRFNITAIAIHGAILPNLQKRLKLGHYPLWSLWAKETAAACATSFSLFSQNKIVHNSDPLLIMQMPRGQAKYQGENWTISARDSLGDIDALLATIYAIGVAATREQVKVGVF